MIRLIVSDLDDTLVHKEEHLAREVVQMVQRLRERGILFTFATGRMPYRAITYARDIDLKIPFVANNGSILFCGGKNAYEKKLYAGDLREVLERYMRRDAELTVLFSYTDRERPLKVTGWVAQRLEKYPGYHEPLGCDSRVWEQWVHKIYVVDARCSGLVGELAAELRRGQAPVSCYPYGEFSMEIVAEGCSKAAGVERLMASLGCDRTEMMAIGDHVNDIALLALAGTGVAVANAAPELKAVANYVTDGERAAGVLEAIERFVLGGE